MTDEPTPLARLAARNEWQGGNRGGVRMSFTPPMSEWEMRGRLWREDNPAGVRTPPRLMIREWETKMRPDVFDLNGKVRRAYRTSYGERLAIQVTVILGVLAGCAIVWTVVWGSDGVR